mmetsp:Transcript_84455/g.171261  ORF Transcript_84455/g.171261 Transcript_84455/m.171261 type:complete len:84 (-) Transcript_84455:12-263(-)
MQNAARDEFVSRETIPRRRINNKNLPDSYSEEMPVVYASSTEPIDLFSTSSHEEDYVFLSAWNRTERIGVFFATRFQMINCDF